MVFNQWSVIGFFYGKPAVDFQRSWIILSSIIREKSWRIYGNIQGIYKGDSVQVKAVPAESSFGLMHSAVKKIYYNEEYENLLHAAEQRVILLCQMCIAD